MADYSTRNIIDYAMDEDGVKFREELYGAIHAKVADHVEAAKLGLAVNMLKSKEEVAAMEEQVELENKLNLHAYSKEQLEDYMQTEDFESLDDVCKTAMINYIAKQ